MHCALKGYWVIIGKIVEINLLTDLLKWKKSYIIEQEW